MSFFSLIFAGFQTVLLCPVVSIPWKTLTVQVLIKSTFGKIIIKFGEMSHIFLSLPPGLFVCSPILCEADSRSKCFASDSILYFDLMNAFHMLQIVDKLFRLID